MELVLPNNYVEIEEEEMMYLDGGWNGWWNSVTTIAFTVDAVLACFGIWSLKGSAAKRWINKNAYSAVGKVARYFGWSYATTGKVTRTVLALGSIAGLSVGFFVAKGIDGADGWFGGTSWNGYCFG